MNGKPTRRTFFTGAGAVLAAPLGVTTVLSAHGESSAGLDAALDDSNAIRVLLHRYARLVSVGAEAELAQLFLDAAGAAVDTNIRSLSPDADANIALAADGTATARMPCTVDTATPIVGGGTLVEMARLQGDGVVKRSEKRVLSSALVKINGIWKLERVEWLA